MQIFIMPAARQEIREAFDWYEQQRRGLGKRFSHELYVQLDRIVENQERFAFVSGDVRRARLHDFPYGIFFRCQDNRLYVVACLHSRRNPLVWQSRV